MWVEGFDIGGKSLEKVNNKRIKLINDHGKIYRLNPYDGRYHVEINGDYNFNDYATRSVLNNYEGSTIYGLYCEEEIIGSFLEKIPEGVNIYFSTKFLLNFFDVDPESVNMSEFKYTVNTDKHLTAYITEPIAISDTSYTLAYTNIETYCEKHNLSLTLYEVEYLPDVGAPSNEMTGILNLYIHRGQGTAHLYINSEWRTLGEYLRMEDKGYYNKGGDQEGVYVWYVGGGGMVILDAVGLQAYYEVGKFTVGSPCLYLHSIDDVTGACFAQFGTLSQEYADVLNRLKISSETMLDMDGMFLLYKPGPKGKMVTDEEQVLSNWVHLYNNGKRVLTDVVSSDKNDFNFALDCDNYFYQSCIHGLYDEYGNPIEPTTEKPISIRVEAIACLTGDTLIKMGDGSEKRLDTIAIGDMVMTPYGEEKVIYSDAKLNKTKSEYTVYEFSDGREIKVVNDHRVYLPKKRRYVHFSTLKIGDRILALPGDGFVYLVKKTVYTEPVNHYTLYTDGTNEYFANGIMCGNIFSNIKPLWLSRFLLWWYNKLIMQKELK